MRTLAGYLSHAIEDSPSIRTTSTSGRRRQLDDARPVLPARACTRSARTRTSRPPRSNWPTGGARRPASRSRRRCLLPMHPRARVYGLPIISGHVGADAAACMLAIDHRGRGPARRAHGHRHEHRADRRQPAPLLAASCPAGPAFEGGAIACGMPGLDGAIEDVRIGRRRLVRARRHRRRRARGHLRLGAGRPAERAAPHRSHERRWDVSTDGEDRIALDADRGSIFLESDVNELAQAKGANVAGLHVVFSDYGIDVRRPRGVLPRGRLRPAPEHRRGAPHRPHPEPAGRENRASRQRRDRRRVHRPVVARPSGASSRRWSGASSIAGSKRIPSFSISSSRAASSSAIELPHRIAS